jgi:hypothetical protein
MWGIPRRLPTPTSPSRCAGPSLSPRARAERGKEIVGRQIAIQPPSTLYAAPET